MNELAQIQAWLDTLSDAYVIQKMRDGRVLCALTMGTVSVSMIRPTFIEAAEACLEHAKHTGTKKRF